MKSHEIDQKSPLASPSYHDESCREVEEDPSDSPRRLSCSSPLSGLSARLLCCTSNNVPKTLHSFAMSDRLREPPFLRNFKSWYSRDVALYLSPRNSTSIGQFPIPLPLLVEEGNFVEVLSCRGSSQWINGYVNNRSGLGEEDDSKTGEVVERELVLVFSVL